MFHKVKWFYYNLLLTFANCDISFYGRGIFCALLSTRSTLPKGNTKLWVLKREEKTQRISTISLWNEIKFRRFFLGARKKKHHSLILIFVFFFSCLGILGHPRLEDLLR